MNPFNPIPVQEETPNKRLGFFGTALQQDEVLDEDEEVEVVYVDEDGNPIEDYVEKKQQRVFPSRKVSAQDRTTFAVTLRSLLFNPAPCLTPPLRDDAMPSSAYKTSGRGAGPMSGSGGGRGRGRGFSGGRSRGGGGGRRSQRNTAAISSVDLDAEMESYMTKR